MKNQPVAIFEPYGDPLSYPPQTGHAAGVHGFQGRSSGTQQKRPADFSALENVANNALLQGFDINNYIRQFGHIKNILS